MARTPRILLRGDTAAVAAFTGIEGELAYNTTTKTIHTQDGSTAGGTPLATKAEVDGKAPTSHTHPTSQVTGLDDALAAKAPTSHTHTTTQVTGLDATLAGLQTDVDGKADTAHTHAIADVTDLQTTLDSKASSADVLPSGLIAPFGQASPPTGWLKCNGQLVSRTTYANLFTAIGTTFGAGDGSTTFGLPDLRGEFVRGLDDSRGVDSARVLGSAQAEATKAHTHGTGATTTSAAVATGADHNVPTYNAVGVTGSAGGSETRPRNVALLYCIKM